MCRLPSSSSFHTVKDADKGQVPRVTSQPPTPFAGISNQMILLSILSVSVGACRFYVYSSAYRSLDLGCQGAYRPGQPQAALACNITLVAIPPAGSSFSIQTATVGYVPNSGSDTTMRESYLWIECLLGQRLGRAMLTSFDVCRPGRLEQ